jgi:anti-sigma-K factor RskA
VPGWKPGVAREARNPWFGDDNSPLHVRPVGAGLGAINQGWGGGGAPPPGRFVAVLQSSANAPAFIITVDVAQRNLTVRRVAAETQTDHSYELWLISNRFQEPRSLGLIGTTEFTRPPTLSAYDPETISDATFAVSLEPEGGSPTGQPTGPFLFSGKLVEAVPPTPAARTP